MSTSRTEFSHIARYLGFFVYTFSKTTKKEVDRQNLELAAFDAPMLFCTHRERRAVGAIQTAVSYAYAV